MLTHACVDDTCELSPFADSSPDHGDTKGCSLGEKRLKQFLYLAYSEGQGQQLRAGRDSLPFVFSSHVRAL